MTQTRIAIMLSLLVTAFGVASGASAPPSEPQTLAVKDDVLEATPSVSAEFLKLARVVPIEGPSQGWPTISPDVRWQAHMNGATLQLRALTPQVKSKDLDGRTLAGDSLIGMGLSDVYSRRWAADSRSIWTATWAWPDGVLQPVKISIEGVITAAQAPVHNNAPMEHLIFVNGHGLAIASYGVRETAVKGKPPVLALIDIEAGATLASLDLSRQVAGMSGKQIKRARYLFSDATTAELADGGVRLAAVMIGERDSWLVLDTKGSARLFPKLSGWSALDRAALSPGGSVLLSARSLQASAPCGYDGPPCYIPSTPDRSPSHVAYAMPSGRELWRLGQDPVSYHLPVRPVFSPDGRIAVVVLPSRPRNGVKGRIGVISMLDGRVLAEVLTQTTVGDLQALDDGRTIAAQTRHHPLLCRGLGADRQTARHFDVFSGPRPVMTLSCRVAPHTADHE